MKKKFAIALSVLALTAGAVHLSGAVSQSSPDVPMTITDFTPAGVNSTLNFNVVGAGNLTDANVMISITHTYSADLAVKLTGPGAPQVVLWSAVGGSSDGFINTVIDDAAATVLTSGTYPYTNSYRSPTSATLMAGFNGTAANGIWTLNVSDNSTGDIGNIDAWSITLDGPPPLPVELQKYAVD